MRLLRRPASLRTQLYLWLLAPMTVLIAASSWLAWRSVAEVAGAVSDRMLLGSARMIGESIGSEDGHLRAELPPAALENLDTGFGDRVYYRVDSLGDGLLSGFSAFPANTRPLGPEQWTSFDTHFRGETVRTLAFAQPVFPFAPGSVVIVQVATTLDAQQSLVLRLWLRSVWPQAVLLAAVALLGWFWVRVALAPVTRISAAVRTRELASNEPIAIDQAPLELRPLVQAVNDYIDRMGHALGEHTRFISNAAHQLKTPITVLNTQITVGLRSTDIAQSHQALAAGHQTVQHCGRLIHQLLTLSATDHKLAPHIAPSPVDLHELAREVLEDLAELAHSKDIDLGMAPRSAPAQVVAVPLMLREMVANLVDNAIRYTPAGGDVTLTLAHENGQVQLDVEDSGPGIPEHERERVFERFYRLPDTAFVDGSGLGLAIVREIALASGALVELLSRSGDGPGLLVRVSFPAALPPQGTKR